MRSGRMVRGITLGVVACLVATAAGAQRRLTVTPFAGGLIPTSTLGQLTISGLTVRGETKTAGVIGGRAALWLGPRWGIEGSYFYSSADFTIVSGPFTQSIDADVQGGTAKVFFQATSAGTGTDIVVGAGLLGIQHGGPAFELASEQFDVGGVVGAGLHVELSPVATFRLDGEALLYRWSAGPSFAASTQTDLMMTVGLALRFGR